MPDLAALIRLDGARVDAAELSPILGAFGARPGRAQSFAGRSFALASLPRTALDRGNERSSLWVDATGSRALLFDGRLDNRGELLACWADAPASSEPPGDAALLWSGYERFGDQAFARIVGPYVALLIDAENRWVRLARDPLGGRTLFFHAAGSALTLASRPAALLADRRVAVAVDESSIARFLSARGPRPGATFFREIEELPPGGSIRWRDGRRESCPALALEPSAPPGAGGERDYEGRFRELLDAAVACRLPESGSTAVLMSGGLDSTAVCATAASRLAARSAPPPLAISWVFRELSGIDETPWIEAALAASGARSRLVVGDELWPLADEPSWPRPLDSPFQSPYWRLRERALGLARDAEAAVLLTGESGDELWSGGNGWLRDLVRTLRFGAALSGALRATAFALRGVEIAHPLRSAIGELLRSPAPRRPQPTAPWLTPWARELLAADGADAPETGPLAAVARRLTKLNAPFDLAHQRAAEREATPFGVEVRRPFRDRRLVELFLGIPSRLLYRPGESKRLLRRALVDRLPREIVSRRVATSLLALGDRGLRDQALPLLRAALDAPDAVWPRYVRRDWLERYAWPALGDGRDGVERVVLWHCYCVERWRSALERPDSLRSSNLWA